MLTNQLFLSFFLVLSWCLFLFRYRCHGLISKRQRLEHSSLRTVRRQRAVMHAREHQHEQPLQSSRRGFQQGDGPSKESLTTISIPLDHWSASYINVDGFGEDFYKVEGQRGIKDMGKAGYYGEILQSGIQDIINMNKVSFGANDVFYDLGSGIGKIVAQFAFETEIGTCRGIELGERRYREGLKALELASLADTSDHKHLSSKISLIKGDVLTVPWNDATVVFINAVCFPAELWAQLEQLLIESTPHLRCLILHGPTMSADASRFPFQSVVVNSPASWDENNTCTLYFK